LQSKENRAVLYGILQKNGNWISSDPDLAANLLSWAGEHFDDGEESVMAYLSLIKSYQGINPAREEQIKAKTIRKLFDSSAKLPSISEATLKNVQEYALNQPIRDDTLESLFDLALNHMQYESSRRLLNSLLKKATESGAVSSQKLGELIFRKLEQTASQRNMRDSAIEGMRRILAQNKNQVPSGNYPTWQNVRNERIQQELVRVLEQTNTVNPKSIQNLWEDKSAEKLSCSWNQLQVEWLEKPLNQSVDRVYKQATDPLAFLDEINQYGKGELSQPMAAIYQNAYVRKLDEQYDALWRKARNQISGGPDTSSDRVRLEQMLKEIENTEGSEFLRTAKNSVAYRAGEYQKELLDLCAKGVELYPEKAGEMINQLIKEKGFDQCISFEKSRYPHPAEDTLFDFTLSLIGELSLQKGSDPSYWEQVLRDIGFQKEQAPWKTENMRSINCLSFITESLSHMGLNQLLVDLKQYLGNEYMRRLWNDNIDKKRFFSQGEWILCKSFYQWLTSIS